jgi:hypothetical protein
VAALLEERQVLLSDLIRSHGRESRRRLSLAGLGDRLEACPPSPSLTFDYFRDIDDRSQAAFALFRTGFTLADITR